jgi:hypothetical protein
MIQEVDDDCKAIFSLYKSDEWTRFMSDAKNSAIPYDFTELQKPKFLSTNLKRGTRDTYEQYLKRLVKFGKNSHSEIQELEGFIYYQVVRDRDIFVLNSPSVIPGDVVFLSKSPFMITFDCVILQSFGFAATGTVNQFINNGSYVRKGYATVLVVGIGKQCVDRSSLVQRNEIRNKKNYKFCIELEKESILFSRTYIIPLIQSSGIEKNCRVYVDIVQMMTDVKLKFLWNGSMISNEKDILEEDWDGILRSLSLATLDTFSTRSGVIGNFLIGEIFRHVNKIKKFDPQLYRSVAIEHIHDVIEGPEMTAYVFGEAVYSFGYYRSLIQNCTTITTGNGSTPLDPNILSELDNFEKKGYLCYILARGKQKKGIECTTMNILMVFVFSVRFENELIEKIEKAREENIFTTILSPYPQDLTRKILNLSKDYECTEASLLSSYLPTRLFFGVTKSILDMISLFCDETQLGTLVSFGVPLTGRRLICEYGKNVYLGGEGSPDFTFLNRGFLQCLSLVHKIKHCVKHDKCPIQ